ncbi:MAG: hypothetical protein KatS3mg121_0769 [Gammaproteobacteria bacterium]|nr:MAG: hypothetical protein KatS3mg121_0769 [Gammaproteobacteria bacterium]
MKRALLVSLLPLFAALGCHEPDPAPTGLQEDPEARNTVIVLAGTRFLEEEDENGQPNDRWVTSLFAQIYTPEGVQIFPAGLDVEAILSDGSSGVLEPTQNSAGQVGYGVTFDPAPLGQTLTFRLALRDDARAEPWFPTGDVPEPTLPPQSGAVTLPPAVTVDAPADASTFLFDPNLSVDVVWSPAGTAEQRRLEFAALCDNTLLSASIPIGDENDPDPGLYSLPLGDLLDEAGAETACDVTLTLVGAQRRHTRSALERRERAVGGAAQPGDHDQHLSEHGEPPVNERKAPFESRALAWLGAALAGGPRRTRTGRWA